MVYYSIYLTLLSVRNATSLSMNIQQRLLLAASTLPRMAFELCETGTHMFLKRSHRLVDAVIKHTIHYVNM